MSSIFFSPGRDPFAHLRKHLEPIPAPAFEGLWGMVDLQPDLFSPQKFSIGVVVATATGTFQYRLISDLSKFDCVYGRVTASSLKPIVTLAEQTLARLVRDGEPLANVQFQSASLSISHLWPTSGSSVERVLSRLFTDVVAMEPSDEKASRSFVTLDTEVVRRFVDAEIKRIAGTKFEKIVVESHHIIPSEDASMSHVLDFNLRTERGAGSVLSAVYKQPSRIELNLLRASRDLATYGKLRKLTDLALFVMTAKREGLEATEFAEMTDVIDDQSWCLEQQGFRVVTFDDPAPLAQSVIEWAAIPD